LLAAAAAAARNLGSPRPRNSLLVAPERCLLKTIQVRNASTSPSIMSLPLNLQNLLAKAGPKATPLNQVIQSVASTPPQSAPASAGVPIELTSDLISIQDRDVAAGARAVIADITKYNAALKFRIGRSIACSRLCAAPLTPACPLLLQCNATAPSLAM